MRKLMWFAIGFGAACAVGSYCWLGKWALLLAALCLGVGIGVRFLPKVKLGRSACVACIGLAVGFVYFFAYDAVYTAPVRALDGQVVELEVTAVDYGWETDYGAAVDGQITVDGKPYRIRFYLNEAILLEPGDVFVGNAKLRLTTDGGQNEPTFHRSNGILLLGYQRGEAEYVYADDTDHTYFAAHLRAKLIRMIETAFPEDSFAFAKALLLGDRTDISYEMSSDFKVSGISHIVAVSGLHMSILFALVYTVTFKRRYLLALFGIPTVLLFMAVAGFTPSVTRAGIMQILMILSLCLNREYDPPTALSFAALVMLVGNPLVAASVGFQLSVGSVAGIFLFSNAIKQWLLLRIPEGKKKAAKRLRTWLASGISISLSSQLFVTPLVAYYYGTVSLIGIATNLAVLWVINFIFYGVMAVCLLGMVSASAAAAAAWIVAWPIRFVIRTAGLLASVPLAAVYTQSVYIVIWLALCYGMIVALIFGKGKRPLIGACIAALGLFAALALSWVEPMLYDHRVTAVDVGQGQCIILQHKGKTFVVDCGGDYADGAADRCSQTLLSMGVQHIDGLILTHYDEDHSGGAAQLLHSIDADALYLPAAEDADIQSLLSAAQDAKLIWVEQDLLLASEGMKITLFAPESGTEGNESSVAVLFQTEKCDTLITGDMSQARERLLLSRTDLPELEVLVAGHHGSKTSTSQALLDATTPEVAIISVGADNSYGHPAQEVLERLNSVGCDIYRTDQSGDIVFRR